MKKALYNSYNRRSLLLKGKYPVYNCLYKKCLLLACIFIGCMSCLPVANAQTAASVPLQNKKVPYLTLDSCLEP